MTNYIQNWSKRLILLLASLMTGISLFAYTFSGITGQVQYSLDTETGILHIYGSGSMGDYNGNWGYGYTGTAPWLNENANGECLRSIWGNCTQYQKYNLRNSIKSVVIEDGVTTVGAAAFYNCPNLEQVEIPNSVTLINYEAFRGCTKLEEVNVPASVTEIRDRWATDCDNMKNINVDPSNAYYTSVNGILYTKDMKTIVKMPDNNLVTDYSIPEGVTQMATDAIYKQRNVVNVVLPTTMASIRYGVFDNCPSLTSFTLRNCEPPTLEKNISGSSKLKTVNVPCGCQTNFQNKQYWRNLANGVIQQKNVVIVNVRANDPALGSVEVKMPSCSDRTVHLVANATELGEFDYWSDEPNNHNFYRTFQAEQNATYDIIAYFKPRKFQLQLVRCSPAADYVLTLKGEGQYEYGSRPTIECIINEPGWVFDSWRTCNDQNKVVSTQNPLTFDIKEYTCYCARIKRGKSLLTVQSANTAMGTVSPNIKNQQYDYGTSMEISATPNEDYVFTQWSDGNTEMTRSITVTSDAVYTAYFKKKTYKITAVPNDPELGSCTGYGTFDKNATVTLTATPIGCGRFVKWTDGEQEYEENPYVFKVKEVKDFVAVFESSNVATEESVTACGSYTWDGTDYTESGDYTKSYTAANGCDSIVTLHLTINQPVSNEISETACETYNWDGMDYTESGDYVKSYTAVNGCDSIVTLHLTINQPVSNEISETACETFNWDGTEYTESGDYVKSYTAANGCDSIVTLHLTINHVVANEISETACETFVWDGTEYTESGDYIKNYTVANGCDSIVTLHLTINQPVSNEISETACEAYNWDGTDYTESGDYVKSYTAANGCDSIVTLHLTINQPVSNEISETACETFDWDGTDYTESGDYIKNYTAANGCDSVVTLHLTINHAVTNEFSEVACGIFSWDGTDYTESGDYIKSYTAANGCDSIVTLHLTVNNSMTNEISESACDRYTWNDTEYTESGDYTKHFTTAAGCDSIVILHLTVNHSEASEFSETACDSYSWNGTDYTESGDYVKTFTNKAGCDSVVTLHLTVNHAVTNEFNATACDTYSWDGTDYTESGDYQKSYTAANGCDSIVTLHLTINNAVTKEISETACDTYTWDGTEYAESGDYTKEYMTVAGCDSIVTLHLTINHSVANEFTVAACETYTWDGTDYAASGDYTKNFTTSLGCDSVVTMHLTIHKDPMGVRYDTMVVCGKNSYKFMDVSYPKGKHDITYRKSNGEGLCDSVINLHLYVVPPISKPDNDTVVKTACMGERITVGFSTSGYLTESHWYVQGELQTESPWDAARVRVDYPGYDNYQYMLVRTTPEGYCADTTLYIYNSTHNIESGALNPMVLFADEDCKATVRLRDYMPGFKDLCSMEITDTICIYNINNTGDHYASATESFTFVDGDSIFWRVGIYGKDGFEYTVSTPAFHQRVTVVDTIVPKIDDLGISYQNRSKEVSDSIVGDVVLPIPMTDVTDHISDNCDAVEDLKIQYSFDGLSYTDFSGMDLLMNVYTEPTKLVYYTITDKGGNTTVDSVRYRIERKSFVGEDSFAVVRDTMVCPSEMPYTWHGAKFTEGGTSKVVGAAHLTVTVAEGYEKTDTVVVCESFVWRDGIEYTNSTKDPIFIVNNGPGECDSLIHLNLTVLNPSSGSDSIVICVKELPYDWNGFTIKGDSTLTLRNIYGCDSLVDVKVVILPIARETIYDTACVSYTLNDSVYTKSGTYEQTLTSNVTGCDSILTLHLVINDVKRQDIFKTVCGSYTLNDSVYTETGVYTQTLVSKETGCDSLLTLHLTVKPLSYSKDTVYVCEGALPIVWHNRVLKGDSIMTFVNYLGCDSIVDVKVIEMPTPITEITDTACGSYTLNGFEYTHSSDYTQRLTSSKNCDSIVILHLTILDPIPQTNVFDTVCGSYTMNDTIYTESGVYEQTLTSSVGCDSIVMLYLTVLPAVEYTFKDSVRGAYDWNGTIYTESGKYQQSFKTESGCDSTVTLDLTIIAAPKVIITDTACSDGLVWNGVLIKESGVYPKVEPTIFGDDSTTILHLTVLPEIVTTIYDTVATSYIWNDTVYTESGIYKQVLKAANGCDSTIILNLKIKDTPREYLTETSCGDFELNDTVYTESGRYEQHLKRADGGDSILVLDLTVLPIYNDTIRDTVCGSYTWLGETYTESGLYMQKFQTQRGCDSIVTLDLTVLDVSVTEMMDTACGSYVFNDTVLTKSGVYEQRYAAANGCDSLVKLNLVILKQPIKVINDTVCFSYKLNDSVYTETGMYEQHFHAKNGCDSIVRLNLVVMSTPTGVAYDTVCGSYTLNGEVITESTSFEQRVNSPTGCDSVITVHLTILPVKFDTLYATSCGDYHINDTVYTQSGKYQQKLESSLGCDSILTIYLEILEPTYGKDTVSICENADYVLWHDYKVSSDTVLSIQNGMGCDSIVEIAVERLPILRSEVSDTACAPYYWHGREYLVSGDFKYDTISSLGCDSVETLHLVILPSYEIFLQDSAVSYYDWNDVRYDSTGLYTQRFTSSLGCDSVVTMMITILEPPADAPVKVKSCISYQWFGKNLTESGIYYEILKNAAGEDSIVAIDLTINQPKINPDTIHYTVCENELPVVWNGYEITKEFSRVILQTVEGCDSFINFRLHILPTYDTLEYETACDTFVWHGKTYTRSGTYHDTLQTIYGCDSTFTLSLNLKHSSVTEIYRNVCESELPIRWNEYEFYHDTIMKFPCSNGCDSIIKVEIVVNKEYHLVYDEVACGDFYWQGELLTISGTYIDSFTTQSGCDSIVTLNLIVTHPYRVDLVDTTIAGTIYEKNGFTVDAQTIGQYEYEVMLKSVYGCDSLVHLSLFVDGRDINITWTNVSGGTVDYLNGERWERKFCSSDEYFANYIIRTGVPDSFKISFDHEGIEQGFKNVSGYLNASDTVGSISFVVPENVAPGTYNVYVQLFGEGKSSKLTPLKIHVGLDYKRVTRMWNDVVVFDNSDHQYVSYQWKKNNVDIPGATGQYYCDYNGLNGFYSLDVVTTTSDTLYVCGRYFEPIDVDFTITTYPVYTNNGKVTVYAKGVTEEELKTARLYVYTLNGVLTYWTNIVHKETEVRVREGRYVCIMVLEDQRSASCRFVSHAVEFSK